MDDPTPAPSLMAVSPEPNAPAATTPQPSAAARPPKRYHQETLDRSLREDYRPAGNAASRQEWAKVVYTFKNKKQTTAVKVGTTLPQFKERVKAHLNRKGKNRDKPFAVCNAGDNLNNAFDDDYVFFENVEVILISKGRLEKQDAARKESTFQVLYESEHSSHEALRSLVLSSQDLLAMQRAVAASRGSYTRVCTTTTNVNADSVNAVGERPTVSIGTTATQTEEPGRDPNCDVFVRKCRELELAGKARLVNSTLEESKKRAVAAVRSFLAEDLRVHEAKQDGPAVD